MAKRKNRHLEIIKQVLPELTAQGYKVTQFHHHRRMPKSLKGAPDLYVMWRGRSWWIEIKPRYQNYMRDQMSDVQWQWFHDRRDDFSEHIQYAIVEDAEELLTAIQMGLEPIKISDYHWDRYETWRKGR